MSLFTSRETNQIKPNQPLLWGLLILYLYFQSYLWQHDRRLLEDIESDLQARAPRISPLHQVTGLASIIGETKNVQAI